MGKVRSPPGHGCFLRQHLVSDVTVTVCGDAMAVDKLLDMAQLRLTEYRCYFPGLAAVSRDVQGHLFQGHPCQFW